MNKINLIKKKLFPFVASEMLIELVESKPEHYDLTSLHCSERGEKNNLGGSKQAARMRWPRSLPFSTLLSFFFIKFNNDHSQLSLRKIHWCYERGDGTESGARANRTCD